MTIHSIRKLILLLAVLLVLLACAVPALPVPAVSNPTLPPGSIETIVVATAGAAQTQTALVLPSPTTTFTTTPLPTSTPTETPTATETFIFSTATKPPTATQPFVTKSAGSNCQLVAQSPVNDTVFAPQEKFTVEWTLKNTGPDAWVRNNVDFFYSEGTDMHKSDILDLPVDVGPNGEVTLTINMVAPKKAGSFTTTWHLGKDKNPFCKVSLTIVVK